MSYYANTFLAILAAIVLTITVMAEVTLEKRVKNSFVISFSLTAVGSFIEAIVLFIDERILTEEKKICSNWHFICVIVFIIISVYMLMNAYKIMKKMQNKISVEFAALTAFVIIGTIVQAFNPEARISWLALVTVGSLMYCNYVNMLKNTDGLTGLKNQRSFSAFMDNAENSKFILIILDVNCFKRINDTFGHNFGDQILAMVGQMLLGVYGQYGKCYRIGGDEFAVVLKNKMENVDMLNQRLEDEIKKKRETVKDFSSLSYGFSMYVPENKMQQSVKNTYEKADGKMYERKMQMYDAMKEKNM